MSVDVAYLKAHFAELADEELLRISSGELVLPMGLARSEKP